MELGPLPFPSSLRTHVKDYRAAIPVIAAIRTAHCPPPKTSVLIGAERDQFLAREVLGENGHAGARERVSHVMMVYIDAGCDMDVI